MSGVVRIAPMGVVAALSVGCALGGAAPDAEPVAMSAPMADEVGGAEAAFEEEAKVSANAAREVPRDIDASFGRRADKKARGPGNAEPPPPPAADGDNAPDKAEGEAGSGRSRSWFPKAFLWAPQLQTGSDGVASVDVLLPDTLTTWRVLGLAHDNAGQQAGTVHEFKGTLPLYVSPVVPGWLFTGDQLVLPVQAVNTTSDTIAATVEVTADGALSGRGVAAVQLEPAGSRVRSIPLVASGAGTARVEASLFAEGRFDSAERTIPVTPAGRPVERTRVGTLSSSRSFDLAAPLVADPSTDRIEVSVFPGPLAVLQLELERLKAGSRPADGAYGFALASRVGDLSSAAGVEVDAATLRRIRILSWQRIARAVAAPDPHEAADLLTSLRDEATHPQVTEILDRLARRVIDGQRADGTWSRTDRATLGGVLVQTAYAVRSLPASEHGARLRAEAAIERHFREVTDAYTAAVILAADLAQGPSHDHLLEIVTQAIETDPDTGERRLEPPATAHNPWGEYPSTAERIAYCVLALPEDAPERGDLAALLMQRWRASAGFGAGRADAVALQAVASALGNATDEVVVALQVGGSEVARATLDPTQPHVPAVLAAATEGTDAPFVVTSQPAVAGLSFVATRRSWIPWTNADRLPGVDIAVSATPLRVGRQGTLTIEVAAPSGAALTIEQGLPSGAVVGDGATAAVGAQGATLDVRTDRVILTTRPFGAGEVQTFAIPVIPAFAGRFSTGPLLVSQVGATPVPHKPFAWQVAPGN